MSAEPMWCVYPHESSAIPLVGADISVSNCVDLSEPLPDLPAVVVVQHIEGKRALAGRVGLDAAVENLDLVGCYRH